MTQLRLQRATSDDAPTCALLYKRATAKRAREIHEQLLSEELQRENPSEEKFGKFRARIDACDRDLEITAAPSSQVETWRGFISNGYAVFLGVVDELPVGFVQLSRGHQGAAARICEFGIDPDYWSNGFGSQMIVATIELLESVGVDSVELSAHNERAGRLYMRAGFASDLTPPRDTGPMSRQLNSIGGPVDVEDALQIPHIDRELLRTSLRDIQLILERALGNLTPTR